MTTHNMEEAEQCDRLVVMADGKVVATGTAAEIIGDRKAAEIRCDDLGIAPSPCSTRAGFAVQLHGKALRVAATAAAVAGLLSRAGIDATIEVVPADLEEAFVAIAAKPAGGMSRTGSGPEPRTPATRSWPSPAADSLPAAMTPRSLREHRCRGGGGPSPGHPLLRHQRRALRRRDRPAGEDFPSYSENLAALPPP